MIKIPLHVLTNNWTEFDGVEPVSFLDIPDTEIMRFPHEVKYRLRAQLVTGGVLVEGTVETAIEAQCGRCLKEFERKVVHEDICHFYDDLGHDLLDVTEDIREDMILAIPINPVCTEDCQGLCPDCGDDLNEAPCNCREQRTNKSVWKDLDDFEFEK